MAASWMTLTVVWANPVMVLDAVLHISCAEYVPTLLSVPVGTEPPAPVNGVDAVKLPSLADSRQLVAW